MSQTGRPLDVWYVCDQAICNFHCPYCAARSALEWAAGKMWAKPEGVQRFRGIIEWIAKLPFRIRLRLQTWGEPFVCKDFLAGVAWLSCQENIEFVELVTNGTFRRSQMEHLQAHGRMKRLSFWITYHSTQVDPGDVVTAACMARDMGAFVVVHALAFPDTLDAVRRIVVLCREAGLRTDVTAGHNFNGYCPDRGFLPLADSGAEELSRLYRHPLALQAMQVAHSAWRGQPCSAGHDYVFVNEDGDVFPCAGYARSVPGSRIGNALQPGHAPLLREAPYAPCLGARACVCKEDYLHLSLFRSCLTMGPSLGYYHLDGDRIVHVGEGDRGGTPP